MGYGWFRATGCELAGRVYEDVLDLLKEGSLGRGWKRLFFGADGSGTLAGSGISAGASDLVYVQNLPRVPMGSWPGTRYTSIQPLQSNKRAASYLQLEQNNLVPILIPFLVARRYFVQAVVTKSGRKSVVVMQTRRTSIPIIGGIL